MANLIADIGNTAVKVSWADGVTLGKSYRYQGEKLRDFILSLTEKEKPEIMVISSVYIISESDLKAFSSICSKLVVLDPSNKELAKDYGLPSYLTYDRVASIVASRYLFGNKDCTIFDFGTTLTIDNIGQNGNYEGGNISLGMRTRVKALNRYSRSLPLVKVSDDIEEIADEFEKSLSSGVVSGIMFEIEGYIKRNPDSIVVFTGGDSNYFAKRMKNSIFVICNLVLLGLALIAVDYVKKNI